jgi:hypothetical protein
MERKKFLEMFILIEARKMEKLLLNLGFRKDHNTTTPHHHNLFSLPR